MITVLTPTYNRRYTLPALYHSLCAQRGHNFEWLIIDDGSDDDTASCVAEFEQEKKIPIRYIRQENGGKHTAINTGVREARGDWIFIVDSDDRLSTDALSVVTHALGAHQARADLVGVCFRKASFDGALIGRVIEASPLLSTPTEAGAWVDGDLAYVFRAASMRCHPFPVIKDEKFVPELYIWNKISDEGVIIFDFERVVYLADYLPDGYTRNFKRHLRANPRGFLIYYWSQIRRERRLLRKIKCLIRSVQCLWFALLKRVSTS